MTEHKAVAERFIGSLRGLVFLAILMVATSASALTLNEARSQGLIGERPDGLIGAVSASASSDVVALVESDGKSYVASREVKVTIGGCGG